MTELCSICLEEITTEYEELECRHRYHKTCIDEWFKEKVDCPICRQSYVINIESPPITVQELPHSTQEITQHRREIIARQIRMQHVLCILTFMNVIIALLYENMLFAVFSFTSFACKGKYYNIPIIIGVFVNVDTIINAVHWYFFDTYKMIICILIFVAVFTQLVLMHYVLSLEMQHYIHGHG